MSDELIVGDDAHPYAWHDEFAHMPDTDERHHGWAHHGLVLTAAGEVIGFHPNGGALLVFDRDGTLLREITCDIVEGHGLTLTTDESGVESIWIADPRVKSRRGADGKYGTDLPFGPTGRVVQIALDDGRVLRELAKPDHPIYAEQNRFYFPTWVAVDETRLGGSGDVWVADGYGASHVHRYDIDGNLLLSLNGEEGGGRFDCPHAIIIDRRGAEPLLYVADRGNARVQVYDLEGTFRRTFGAGWLTSPSAFAIHNEYLVVAELRARIVVLDANDELVVALGENEETCDRPGWPNSLDDSGDPAMLVRNKFLEAGKFSSPHGLSVDADGNLYVAEWLIGGRMTKLLPK